MIRSFAAAALAIGLGVAAIVPAQAQEGLRMIQGRWANPNTGQTFEIRKGFIGYEAWLSWIGQASITPSSVSGSHIKIESADGSRPGIQCFFYVSIAPTGGPARYQMIWEKRAPSTPDCPRGGLWQSVL